MADNFDLRKFLSENKLTKNAQLLKEEVTVNGKPVDMGSIEIDGIDTEDYPDFVDAYITYAEYEDGTPLTEDELMKLEEENYGIVGELIHDRQLYLQEGLQLNEDNLEVKSIAKQLYSWLKQNGVNTKLIAQVPSTSYGKQIGASLKGGSDEALVAYYDDPKTKQTVIQIQLYGGPTSKDLVIQVEKQLLSSYPKLEQYDRQEVPTPQFFNLNFKVREKTTAKGGLAGNTQQNVKESALSAREKYLTRLVENALGLEGYGDDNVNKQREKQGLPPAQGPKYSEGVSGDEMANETVIPEYSSIDELMKSIDHGTNKVAEEHKIQEMKKIAEALRMKAKKMEESEHAAHISPKDLKQLATDAAKLEKAAEKLKATFDKKFNKKEKSASAPKAEKVEALQETTMENFDLKKFLTENKLTTNSRMLNENMSYDDFEEMVKPFLDLAKSKGWVWNSSGNGWYSMSSPAIALYHKDTLPTTKDGEYKGQPTELGKDSVANRVMNVRGPLETKSADVIMSPDYRLEQAYFYSKDKAILDSIKDRMASYVDVIQDIKETSSNFTSGGDFEPQKYYYMLLRKKKA